jgi:hypothetical protein
MVRFECVFEDRASTFGVIFALISRPNKLPVVRADEFAMNRPEDPHPQSVPSFAPTEFRFLSIEASSPWSHVRGL